MSTTITAIALVVITLLISLKGFSDPAFFEKYKFQVGPIRKGEYMRMLTSGFLHVDWTHFLVNMFTLYFFASVVTAYLGTLNFVLIYLVSLLAGNFLSLFFYKNDYDYSAVGASGAVTGVLYSAILLRPEMELFVMFIPIPIPAYLFGIAYLLFSIYGMNKRLGNIGHAAHFGGAVGGYLLTLALMPGLINAHPLMVLLLAIPIVLLFILQKIKKV